jgi:hypothetical protein
MTTYEITAEKLVELAATPIPDATLELIKDADPKDAAQIGWSNCFQMFQAALSRKEGTEAVSRDCPNCGGSGMSGPARDLLARSPRDEADYQRHLKLFPKTKCGICGGTGKVDWPEIESHK